MATIADLIAQVLNVTAASVAVLPVASRELFVNDTVRRIERKHLFRANSVTVPLAYPANTDFVVLPPDFITEEGVYQRQVAITDPSKALTPITKTLRRFWIEARDPQVLTDTVFPSVAAPTATSPVPYYYVAWPNLAIVPTPTAAISLVLDYKATLSDLTGTGSNWFTQVLPELLVAGALSEAYHFLHDEERAIPWEALFQARLMEAIRFDEALAAGGPPQARGRG